jgi:hypothetical protein
MSDTTLLDDLRANHRAMGRDESIYSRAITEIERLLARVAELEALPRGITVTDAWPAWPSGMTAGQLLWHEAREAGGNDECQ